MPTGSAEGGGVALVLPVVLVTEAYLGWVVLVFLRCWSRWPSAVISEFGRCFLTIDTDRPGQVVKNPLLMACNQVDTTGYPAAAWRNVTRSCAVLMAKVLIAKFA